jgi:hypothetical protein
MYINNNTMAELMEQDVNRSSYTRRRKQLEYSCGCRYLFNHQIILEHVCPEHEIELITLHS